MRRKQEARDPADDWLPAGNRERDGETLETTRRKRELSEETLNEFTRYFCDSVDDFN